MRNPDSNMHSSSLLTSSVMLGTWNSLIMPLSFKLLAYWESCKLSSHASTLGKACTERVINERKREREREWGRREGGKERECVRNHTSLDVATELDDMGTGSEEVDGITPWACSIIRTVTSTNGINSLWVWVRSVWHVKMWWGYKMWGYVTCEVRMDVWQC